MTLSTIQYLTESEKQLIVSALYIARDEYKYCAAQTVSLRAQFTKQAEQAEQLAEKIEAQL